MYDSITAADIPTDCDLVAGYIDGGYKWPESWWTRFPGKVKVRVAVLASTNDGHVLDVETGDATPDQAPDWVARRRRAGADPTIYCNLSNMGAIMDAFNAAGVARPHLWLAHYDGDATLPAGYVAKQYADAAMTGGHYDASVVADFWPGVDMDRAQYAAEIEPFVKETILSQLLHDPETISATTNIATSDRAVIVGGTKLTEVVQGALAAEAAKIPAP